MEPCITYMCIFDSVSWIFDIASAISKITDQILVIQIIQLILKHRFEMCMMLIENSATFTKKVESCRALSSALILFQFFQENKIFK